MQPLRLTLTNLAEPLVLTVPNHPADPEFGSRELVMGSELFIDQADFREEANKQFKRLVLGKRVRLRGGLVIEGERCEKDADGNIVRVLARCVTSVPGTDPEDGVKPKGVIQWVSAEHGLLATIRRYDRLFAVPEPGREDDMLAALNPKSLEVVDGAMVEPGLSEGEPEQVFQFEREGYFVADRYDHAPGTPVFNLTIGLRDTWSASHG
jgi:glutaminyl-tRNA synthetase